MNLKVVSKFDENTENLARQVVDCAFQVHSHMRAGLLEKIYEECFVCELKDRNIRFERQMPIQLSYKQHRLDIDYKIDLVIENRIIVELKSVEKIMPVHKAQLLSYMHLTAIGLGFLINFNVPLIKEGLSRIAL